VPFEGLGGVVREGRALNTRNQKRKTGARGRRFAGFSGEHNSSRMAYDGGGRWHSVLPAVILFCAVFAVLVAADYWMNAGKVYRGVEVGDVSLGGKTPAEAKEIIGERERRKIEFSGPDKLAFSASQLGASYDAEATARRAYAVGREGDIPGRLAERFEAAFGTVEIPSEVDYRPRRARAAVEKLASRVNRKPREARVAINGSEVQTAESRDGYRLNIDETVRNVGEAVRDMGGQAEAGGKVLKPEYTTAEAQKAAGKARAAMGGRLTFTAGDRQWTVPPVAIGSALDITAKGGDFRVALNRDRMKENLAGAYDALTVEPREANFEIDGTNVSVTPSRTGKRVQDDKLFSAVEAGLFGGRHSFDIPVVTDEPKLTTAKAEKLKPTTLLGSYKTNYNTYDDSPGRVENLKIASSAVSGTMLAPGEVFSFNALAAPLDYYPTKVIVKGRVDEAEGGGLCQVSSTLYMAVNLAGLKPVERQPHYAELPYIRPGFDATVWFGAIDMKFENTNDSYVLVRERVDESTGWVYAQIWGRPNGKDVKMNSKKASENKDSEGNPVTKWVTYKTVKKDGKVLFDGVFHTDTYKYLKPTDEGAPNTDRPPN